MMKKSTNSQVLIFVILLGVLVLFLDRIYGSYIHIWNILSPIFFFISVIGLFLLSCFIARNIFKKDRQFDYYVLISCLTILFYAIAWVMLGLAQGEVGTSCIADIACLDARSLPVWQVIWPVALGALIFPIGAYGFFGEKHNNKRTKSNNSLAHDGSIPSQLSDIATLVGVGILIAIILGFILFRAYFHIDWSGFTLF